MKNPINRVQLTGNIGKEPELMTTNTGAKYVRLSLATNEFYTNRTGEKVNETNWHNVIAWGQLAERIAVSMHKGDEITVEGSLRSRSYDDKEGKRRYVTEVLIFECTSVKQEIAAAATE